MAIGAQDYIDQLLVDKYATEQVDNHGSMESVVKADTMLNNMNYFSNMSRDMLALNQKLQSTCYALKAANAQYKKAAVLDENGEYEETEAAA